MSKTFRNRRSTTIWIEAFRTINLWSAIWKTNAFYLFIDLAQNSLNLIFKWKQKNPVILRIYCSYWIMITQINLPSLTPRVLHCLISLPQPRIHTHSGCTYVLASWSTPIEANGVRKSNVPVSPVGIVISDVKILELCHHVATRIFAFLLRLVLCL